jgi:hypothetical protein
MMARVIALLPLLAIWLGVSSDTASACSCEPPPASVRSFAATKAWQFEKASTVVRGRILSIRAGDDAVRQGRRIVLVTMRVHAVLKGSAETGDTTFVTRASSVSCGMGEALLTAAEGGQDLSIELSTIPEFSGERSASWCSYYLFGPDPNSPQGR